GERGGGGRWWVGGGGGCRGVRRRTGRPRTIVDAGWPRAATSSVGVGGVTTARCRLMASSRSRDDVELDLEAGLALRGPHGARRRPVGDVLPVDPVEDVVLDAVVDQRVNLHEPIERGAGRFEQELEVAEDDVCFFRQRAVPALAGRGI